MIYEKERRYIIPFEDVPAARAVMPEISTEERRGNFVEVETGFPDEIATRESKRCLGCRRCLGCALCWAECKPVAIDFSLPDQTLELEFDEAVLTAGQDNQYRPFSRKLGYGQHPDVITDLQFERMLSDTGPTQGLVVSPLSGDVPRRLAIVQGNPEGDAGHLLSSLVLGVNEAILALERAEGLEVALISPINGEFKERFGADAAAVAGLQVLEGAAVSVERAAAGEPLKLTYRQAGENRTEDFDLVVVLTQPKPPAEIAALSRKLELPIG